MLDAPGDPQQVATAYEQGFKDQGWSAPSGDVGMSPGGGFQGSTPPVSKLLCKGESAYRQKALATAESEAPPADAGKSDKKADPLTSLPSEIPPGLFLDEK